MLNRTFIHNIFTSKQLNFLKVMKKEQKSNLINDYSKIVTECIKRRKECKFSQDRMSELLKVSKGKINSLETLLVIDFLFLEIYCGFFGIDVSLFSSNKWNVRNKILS